MTMVTILKLVVLFGALIGFWFGIMLVFFYEQFQIFDQAITVQYLVGRKSYQTKRSGFLIDQLVVKSHTIFGVVVFLVAGWLLWVFFQSFAVK